MSWIQSVAFVVRILSSLLEDVQRAQCMMNEKDFHLAFYGTVQTMYTVQPSRERATSWFS